ncbi:hypothetical protein JQ615_18050 [Bradyrhizobium jicamae]|uniref:Uncharacterized protein n=1 Tax=Bradyrhizobium jicamae TaxID=280332 RepID=A0ABS5FKH8_9BRAD|nr:hypothetical protein [Bradyrhizobium jicamae]MBR0797294.1 hypothetical protein [Bradyrhizobium jicamae]
MQIDIPATPSRFDAVPIGGFFARKTDFGLCVSVDGKSKAAIIFSMNGARLQLGGLPYEVLYYPEATAQADLKSAVSRTENELPYGALVKSANGSYYIQVSDGGPTGHYRTFNVVTGLQEDLPSDAPAVSYGRWSVGLTRSASTDFQALLDWDFSASSQ